MTFRFPVQTTFDAKRRWSLRSILLTLICCGALMPAVSSADSLTAPVPRDDGQAIVVLGDSISAGYGIQRDEGWVHLLDEVLAQREEAWFMVNASISGETTGGGRARLDAILDEHEPGIVIIELGGNDGLRGYPIKRIRENLTAMIADVRAAGAVPMLFAMRIPPNYGIRYAQAFDNVFAEVAAATETLLVPFFLEDVALEDGMMQDDGIHPTAAAQPQMTDVVWEYLAPLLATQS